ncbi:hypothetical protein [Porphyromonas levii]|uniref:hypothetical protein n=1 Tax=Porphyromonas levii TaxID=28114 RepID=UPI001B8AEB38|nr:hypothetical protein [Porphyromonas levii]MBR8713569.1 hypothetical protein [Porphyromonas levii]MBR8715612.1 hypothetical protein [Porphyromonas levii]MBR8728128.1 hypothetical protein [Porphyromonas levii]MBR8736513.1 hypothetical protein [Porphyromonas levii]MBR8778494.1 hypothetical protein [Porphyromonas levii]
MKILYNNITKGAFLFLLSLFALSACSNSRNEEPDVHSTVKEGERFTTRVAINSSELESFKLRAGIEKIEDVKSLRVLVFDENQNFLYSEDVKTLGETTDIALDKDGQFLPDHLQDGITSIREFEVSLIKSSKKRYVHFVANHDWTGFTQDYYAVGTSAGEFMTHPSLVDKYEDLHGASPKPSDLSLWSVYEADQLDENTFKDKVVKLLRTYAKVTIKVGDAVNDPTKSERFELTGYAFCNVPDRGTIAPFETSLYHYEFPFSPNFATKPVDMKLMNEESAVAEGTSPLTFTKVDDPTKETEPYYLFEKDNTKEDHKTFLIIKGIRTNTDKGINEEERYYKIDLVDRKDAKSINTYFPILRNKYYTVNINGVKSDGFKTVKEAIEAPAGNNVFADTKLQEFGKISDGTLSLSVDPIQLVAVRKKTYSFNVLYTGDEKYLKYYPSWNVTDLNDQGESGYKYAAGDDPFMGGLRKTPTGFEIDVLSIPTDATKEFTVEVVALRQLHDADGNVISSVDGTSGATVPITRTVHITLNTPYPFNAELKTGAESDQKILSFRVYEEQVFPKSTFPFEVLIEAPGLTPVNDGTGKKNVTIENIYDKERGKIVSYYKYIVQETDRGRVELPFKVNNPLAGTGDVRLTSEFYKDELIPDQKTIIYKNILDLKYLDPAILNNYEKDFTDSDTFEFTFKGETFNADQLLSKYGIVMKVNTATRYTYGDYIFDVPKSFLDAYGAESLTLTSYKTFDPTAGKVVYTLNKTMTVSDWLSNKVESTSTTAPTPKAVVFGLSHVEVIGRVFYWYKYSTYGIKYYQSATPNNPTYELLATADSNGNDTNPAKFTTADFNIDPPHYHYSDYDYSRSAYFHRFTLKFSNEGQMKDKFYLKLDYTGYPYGSEIKSLGDLLNNPIFEINIGSYR